MSAPITDDSDLAQPYQSLSPSAVLSVVLGLISPAVLLGAVLVVLPVVTMVVATSALRRIRQSDGTLTGRNLALTGLALGVASLSCWIARDQVSNYLLHQQAQQIAQPFLQHLADGDLAEAFLLSTTTAERPTIRALLAQRQRENNSQPHADHDHSGHDHSGHSHQPDIPGPTTRFENFQHLPAVQQLTTSAQVQKISLQSRDKLENRGPYVQLLQQTYRVTRQSGNPLNLLLKIEIRQPPGASPAFRVSHIEPAANP